MSIPKSGTDSPNSENRNTTLTRLVDLETGEISNADFGSLLDNVFGAATAEHSDPFSERAPQRREAPNMGLYSMPYRADEGKSISVTVYADMLQARKLRMVKQRQRQTYTASTPPTGRDEAGRRYVTAEDAERLVGRRGVVVGFGRKPRKRMVQTLARIRNVVGGHFLTLTASDTTWEDYSPDDQTGMAIFLKAKLHALQKRLIARFPMVGGIWRMEFKARKSGALLGVVVPHIHILAFGIVGAGLDLLRAWLSDAWYEVVRSGDEKHLGAGTNCRALSSRRHAAAYVAKYVGKEESDEFKAGRRWGTFGQLDQSASVTIDLTLNEWVQLKRLVRSWLKTRQSRFQRQFASIPPSLGASVLGLGDQSSTDYGLFEPTVFRMLLAVKPNMKSFESEETR